MKSRWKSIGESIFSEVRRILIELTIFFIIVSLVGVAVFYLFPIFIDSSGTNWRVEKNDLVAIHYLEKESPEIDSEKLLESITGARKDIAERLHLENPPNRVHVYLHEDLNSLRSVIARRKGSSAVSTPLATIDLVYDSSIKPLLVRALTLFSWGEPSSEFLRLGLQGWLSNNVSNHHVRIAALGQAFLLTEVSKLEQVGKIPRTLQEKIYDYFDSPNAPAGMNLSQFSSLIRQEESERMFQERLEVESISFVSYLINKFGVSEVRTIWEADSLREGIEEAFGLSLDKLSEEWLDFVDNRVGNDNPVYLYYRGRFLFTKGRLKEAKNLLEAKIRPGMDRDKYKSKKDVLFLKGQISFFKGDWKEASDYFEMLKDLEQGENLGKKTNAYLELLRSYREGKKRNPGETTLFESGYKRKTTDLVEGVSRTLEKAKKSLPILKDSYDLLKVFLIQSQFQKKLWYKLDLPNWVITESSSSALSNEISEFVASKLTRTPTYSDLLRQGLISFLARKEVFSSAVQILSKGNWKPLNSILVGTDEDPAKKAEAGSFVGYILKEYGSKKFSRIWFLTTPLGGDKSLTSALNQVIGLWLGQLETNLKDFLFTLHSQKGSER